MQRLGMILLLLAAGCVGAWAEGYEAAVKVQPLLKTTTDAAGQKLVYGQAAPAELTAVVVEIAPGQETGWHTHPNPSAAYILEGEVTVEDAGGGKRRYVAGEAFAEVVNLKHNGINTGDKPVKILMVVAGVEGAPISEK